MRAGDRKRRDLDGPPIANDGWSWAAARSSALLLAALTGRDPDDLVPPAPPPPAPQPRPAVTWVLPERRRDKPAPSAARRWTHLADLRTRLLELAADALAADRAAVLGRSRVREAVHARWAAMHAISAARPDLSLPRLGRLFGMDHTTVLHARRTLPRRMAADVDLAVVCAWLAGIARAEVADAMKGGDDAR